MLEKRLMVERAVVRVLADCVALRAEKRKQGVPKLVLPPDEIDQIRDFWRADVRLTAALRDRGIPA
jgi:hypothetical protein